jgi:hypothetical protein
MQLSAENALCRQKIPLPESWNGIEAVASSHPSKKKKKYEKKKENTAYTKSNMWKL